MADQGAASAAAGAAAGPLWTKHHSRSRNCPYYFNTKTGEKSWDPPAVKAAVTLPTEVAPAVAVPHDPAGAGAARRDSARRDASRELGGHGTSQNGGSAPGSAAGRWRIDAQVRTADGGGVQDWREVVTLPAHADGPLEGRWVEVAFHTVLRLAADIEDVVRVRLLDLRGAVASQEPVCLYEWLRGERPTPRLHPRCIVWDADAVSSVSGHGARVPPPRRDPRARGDRDDRACVLQPAAVLCHELWSGRGPTADGSSSVGLTEGVEPPPACMAWLEEFPAPPSLPQRGFRWAPAACEAMRFAATCPAVDDAPPGGLWCRMAAWVHNHVTASHRVELVAEMHRRAKVGEGYDALADYAERMRDRRADALAAAAPGRGRGLQAGVPVVVELLGFADRPLASMATAGEWSDFRVGRVHRPPKVMMLEQPLQPEIPTAPDEWRPPVTRELAIGPNETRYTMWTRDARPMLHTPYATAAIREATQRDLAAAAAGVDLDAVGDDPGNRRTTIDLLPPGVVSRVRVYADIGAGWGRFTKWMSYELKLSKQQAFAVDQYKDNKRFAKNISYIAGDAHKLPFRDGEVDLLSIMSVLHHLEDVAAAAVEMARCLSPGGHLLIREYDVDSDEHAAFATIVHKLDAELVRGMHPADHPKKHGHSPGMVSRMYGNRASWAALLATAGFVQVAMTETSGTYGCFHAVFQKSLGERTGSVQGNVQGERKRSAENDDDETGQAARPDKVRRTQPDDTGD